MSHLTPWALPFDRSPETSPHVPALDTSAFQSAFAHLCDLSARAIYDGAGRDGVLQAFQGLGDAHPDILAARVHVSHRIALVKHNAARDGVGPRTVAAELVKAGRLVREVAEVEWMVELPIVNPNP